MFARERVKQGSLREMSQKSSEYPQKTADFAGDVTIFGTSPAVRHLINGTFKQRSL